MSSLREKDAAGSALALNDQQRQAVLHEAGPMLVLAGAGSGKTRVITNRIAHLITDRGESPAGILAVTFTNKAAEEMRERVARLAGGLKEKPWVGTFHAFCARLLRRYIAALGYPSSFTIYDVNDQLAVIKKVLSELRVEDRRPAEVQSAFSAAKNGKSGPAAALDLEDDIRLPELFEAYEKAMKSSFALDFDDLLLRSVELLESRDDIQGQVRRRCEHILVDEFQDTNYPQNRLLQLLAPPQNNICVVGDDDQSIYRWRGADVENIRHFEADFPGCVVIKLEQNYRSTQNILDAAHGVVSRLTGRHPKRLWTDRGAGERVTLFIADSEGSEASFVVSQMESLLARHEPSDFAVLFRTNAQSRAFEEAFARHRIPVQVIGGMRFYERQEIKDVLAYLNLARNLDDSVSLRRVINRPARGIGDVTVSKLDHRAREQNISLWAVLDTQLLFVNISPAVKRALTLFKNLIEALREQVEHNEPPSAVIDFILKDSGYLGELVKANDADSAARIDNLRELIAAAKTFERENPDAGVNGFLDQAALVADIDALEPAARKVTLMTLHCAKGLEFDFVFLTGLEEGLLPHSRNAESLSGLEEERRLCYVGMTRAREKLFLTAARLRQTFKGTSAQKPSRFIEDIPPAHLDERGESAKRATRRRYSTAGEDLDNIEKFFRSRKIDIDVSKLARHVPSDSGEFKAGDKVRSSKYGVGKVLGKQGSGDGLTYRVHFPGHGPKKLLARVAKLEKA